MLTFLVDGSTLRVHQLGIDLLISFSKVLGLLLGSANSPKVAEANLNTALLAKMFSLMTAN